MAHSNVTKNYLLNLIYQILTMLVPLITTPYISRVLGAEGIGTYSYTYSIVTYFTLVAALGTTTYAQREIAYVQQSPYKYSLIFWEIVILRFILSISCGIIYFIYISYNGNFEIGLAQGLYLVGLAVDISWFFQGLEEFFKIILQSIFIKTINIIFVFVFIKSSDDLLIYIFGLAFLPIVGNALLWFYLPKLLNKVSFRKLQPSKHVKGTLQLFVPTVAIQIYTVLDKTMLGIFTDTKEQNGYYEQASGLVRMCLTLITSLGTVMTPRISNMFVNGNFKILKEYIVGSYRFACFLSLPIIGGLIMVSDIFVPWFYGNGFNDVILLIQIFTVLIIAAGLNNITGMQYLVPTKRQNIYSITVIIGAITNVTLNCVLIPLFAAKGAAIASVIAESVITSSQFIYIVYIEKTFSWSDVSNGIWKYLLSCVVMVTALALLKKYIGTSISNLLLLILTGIFLYFGMLLLLKDTFFTSILTRLLNFFHKRKSH